MQYPTRAEVLAADRVQLGRWLRHLGSPGMSAISADADAATVEEVRQREAPVLDLVAERFKALGGWEPWISKAVGWDDQ